MNTDPERVLAALDGATGQEEVLAAAVYRASAHLHQWDTGGGVRRQLLALDAARYGDRELASRIATVPVEGQQVARWEVEWATGGGLVGPPLRHTITGHTDEVYAAATVVVNGRPVTVTGGADCTVRVWDVATGQPVGEPFTGHTGAVSAVATGVVNGCLVAVTGSHDETVRVWDLTTGQQIGEPLTGHADWVRGVATAVVDGRSVAVSGSDDRTVRVWNLATGQQIDEPLTGHTSRVWAVATAVVDGRSVAVSGSDDRTVRVWNLATGQQIGEPLIPPFGAAHLVATGLVDGRPVAVTSGIEEFGYNPNVIAVRVWDLATREQNVPFLSFPSLVNAVAVVPGAGLLVGFDRELAFFSPR
ncbi:WD40 repeat domain-containing protein [Streptomyces sp. NPDC001750]|uniref:WD40 repeat domain-containing protein n=1 Tax=Streptomyces sp. NPDC001750 TaxID=3364607 RepID=UPI0036AF32A1